MLTPRADRLLGHERIEIQGKTTAQPGKSAQCPRLLEKGRRRESGRVPRVPVSGVLDDPHNVDAPVLRLLVLKPNAAERNAHDDLVAPGGQVTSGVVHEIRTEVGRWRAGVGGDPICPLHQCAFRDRAVFLHAECVDRKYQRLTGMEKGGDDQLDVVVAVDLVAVGECRVHGAMHLVRADAEIDRPRRVPDEDLRRVLGRHGVRRLILGKTREDRGLPPRCRRERAVDRCLRFEVRNADIELAAPAVVRALTRGCAVRRAGGARVVLHRHDHRAAPLSVSPARGDSNEQERNQRAAHVSSSQRGVGPTPQRAG